MKFSQRIGKRPIKTVLQVESMDDDLRTRLWNTILENFFGQIDSYATPGTDSLKAKICRLIWKEFFKYPIDEIPTYSNSKSVYIDGFISDLRTWFFRVEWFEVYDLVEHLGLISTNILKTDFVSQCNRALEKEVAGYRIVSDKVVQITSEEEVQAIEEANSTTEKWSSVNTHLRSALDLLADRKNPDYRNSIKESISAIEAFCVIITGDKSATLGKALSDIEKKHSLHGALKTAFSAIYGYTSDAGGIRHALTEGGVTVEFEDAKFMLVSCSAFVNYLKTKLKI